MFIFSNREIKCLNCGKLFKENDWQYCLFCGFPKAYTLNSKEFNPKTNGRLLQILYGPPRPSYNCKCAKCGHSWYDEKLDASFKFESFEEFEEFEEIDENENFENSNKKKDAPTENKYKPVCPKCNEPI